MKITFTRSAYVLEQLKRGSTDPRILEYSKYFMPAAHRTRINEIMAAEEQAAVASHDGERP